MNNDIVNPPLERRKGNFSLGRPKAKSVDRPIANSSPELGRRDWGNPPKAPAIPGYAFLKRRTSSEPDLRARSSNENPCSNLVTPNVTIKNDLLIYYDEHGCKKYSLSTLCDLFSREKIPPKQNLLSVAYDFLTQKSAPPSEDPLVSEFPEPVRYEVAKAVVKKNIFLFLRNIENFGIKTADYRYKLVLACIKINSRKTLQHLDEFGNFNPDQNYNILLVCAKANGESVASIFRKFDYLDLEYDQVRNIALACAVQNGGATAYHYKNFRLTIARHQAEVQLACATNDGATAAWNIGNFDITDRRHLIKVLRTCVKYGGRGAAVSFKGAGITAPREKLEFALISARNGGYGLLDELSYFELDHVSDPLGVITVLIAYEQSDLAKHNNEDYAWWKAGQSFLDDESFRLRHPSVTFFDTRYKPSNTVLSEHPLVQLDSGKLPFESLCLALPAFSGDAKTGLASSQDDELAQAEKIAFFATADKWSSFFTLKQENGDGLTVRRDLKLKNQLNRLKKLNIMPTESECREMLSTVSTIEQWNEIIGHHAMLQRLKENKLAFQALFDAAKLPGKSEFAAQARLMQCQWLRNVIMQIDLHGIDTATLNALLPVFQRIGALADSRVKYQITDMLFQTLEETMQNLKAGASGIGKIKSLPVFACLPFIETNAFLRDALAADEKTRSPRLKEYSVSRPFISAFMALRAFPLRRQDKDRLLQRIFSDAESNIRFVLSETQKVEELSGFSFEFLQRFAEQDDSLALDALLKEMDGALDLLLPQLSIPDSDKEALKQRIEERMKGSKSKTDILFIKSEMCKLEALLLLDEDAAQRLLERDDSVTLDSLLTETIENKLASDEKIDLTKYMAEFGSYRDPMTLPIYISRIEGIKPAMHGVRALVQAVSNKRYPEVRYLKDKLLNRCGTELIAKWKARHEAPLDPPAETLITVEKEFNRSGAIGGLSHDLQAAPATPLPAQSSQSRKDWKLVNTDEHQELMRMGTDVAGSCQRIDGKPTIVQGLIGSVMDGKTRICTIHNAQGGIVARLILRMMWDLDQNRPCLFMERIYPVKGDPELKDRLMNYAASRAKSMGLDLAAHDKYDEFKRYPDCTSKLESGEFKYPVYSDVVEGVIGKSFTLTSEIRKLKWIYRHDDRTQERSRAPV